MKNPAREQLREMVETIRVVGLSDVRIGEMDDQPGWPDLQDSLDKANALLAKPDTLVDENTRLRELLVSIFKAGDEEDVIEMQHKVMQARQSFGSYE